MCVTHSVWHLHWATSTVLYFSETTDIGSFSLLPRHLSKPASVLLTLTRASSSEPSRADLTMRSVCVPHIYGSLKIKSHVFQKTIPHCSGNKKAGCLCGQGALCLSAMPRHPWHTNIPKESPERRLCSIPFNRRAGPKCEEH